MDRPEVFMSVGRTWTPEQESFVNEIEGILDAHGLETFTIGRNTFTAAGPLERILEVMRTCHGLIAVAFGRTTVKEGIDHSALEGKGVSFDMRTYSTPWHHIEMSMAYTLKLPVLVILERGVFEEGLLEDKYGWYIYRAAIGAKTTASKELQGILVDWCDRVKKRQAAPPEVANPEDLTLAKLFGGMKVSHLWATLAAIVALVVGSFSLGAWGKAWFGAAPTPAGSTAPVSSAPHP